MRQIVLLALCLGALFASPALAEALATEAVTTESGVVAVEKLAALENPWGMALLPDGSLLITEKPGRLRRYADGQLSAPILGVPPVAYGGQGGLLDVAIDPAFETNNLVYLYFVERPDHQPEDISDPIDPRLGDVSIEGDGLRGGAVLRGELGATRLSHRRIIWRQTPKTLARGQYGGRLAFGPDGALFITSGDRQRFDPAQDKATNIGAIMRINPDGSIPNDNPFVGVPDVDAAIYSLGHRNPLGLGFDPRTGHLWSHEMGPQGGDELNLIRPGENYGWPLASEGEHYDGQMIPAHRDLAEIAGPVASWTPSIAPSGMAFYKGDLFPGWAGDMLIGGLVSESLWRLRLDGETVTHQERIEIGERVRDVAVAADGAILLLTEGPNGGLLRLAPAEETASVATP